MNKLAFKKLKDGDVLITKKDLFVRSAGSESTGDGRSRITNLQITDKPYIRENPDPGTEKQVADLSKFIVPKGTKLRFKKDEGLIQGGRVEILMSSFPSSIPRRLWRQAFIYHEFFLAVDLLKGSSNENIRQLVQVLQDALMEHLPQDLHNSIKKELDELINKYIKS